MKIAIIGGASARTPLLVGGLGRSDLPLSEVSLYDIDRGRLGVIAGLAQRMAPAVRVVATDTPAVCVTGADFIFTSIRVGGISRRARDERVCLEQGAIGQETVGPAGFAMAVRTIPVMVEYAHLIASVAPEALIVDFTNPVGIVTQVVQAQTDARIVGICDTPTELFHDASRMLDLPIETCRFDYFGLNHLGWLREVHLNGEPQLGRLWQDPRTLESLYRAPLFDSAFLARLRLLPTEYLYYYYRPQEAFERMRAASRTRGAEIESLDAALFGTLNSGADTVEVYRHYMNERSAGYMRIEAGNKTMERRSNGLTGYDRIAVEVVSAIHNDTNAVIPLDVRNDDIIPDLLPDDVVEVPCRVGATGVHPLPVGPLPAQVRDLVVAVKAYERATIAAALSRRRDAAVSALALNPLVADEDHAARLVDALDPLW